MKPKEIVAYVRVSTEGQHKSGLGEDGQRRALADFAAQHGVRIAAEVLGQPRPAGLRRSPSGLG